MPALNRASATAVLIATLASCALLAAGCGSSGGGSGSASGSADSGDVTAALGTAGVIPTDSAFVFSVDVEQGGDGPISQARTLLKRIPAYTLLDQRIPTPDAIVADLDSDGPKVTWAQVKPWLGKHIGAAVWLDGTGATAKPSEIVWIDTTDTKKAEAFIKQRPDAKTDTYKDITVHTEKPSSSSTGVAASDSGSWAIVDKELVVGPDAAAIEHSIDASKGTSLESTSDFKRLTNFGSGRTPLASVMVTKNLFDHLTDWSAIAAKQDKGTTASDQQLSTLLQSPQLSKLQGKVDGVSLGIGTDSNGIWADVDGAGAAVAQSDDGSDVRGALDKLPQASLVAFASHAGFAGNASGDPVSSSQLSALSQLGKSDPALAKLGTAVQGVATTLSSDDNRKLIAKAYSGDDQFALVGTSTALSFLSRYGVKDKDAAQQETGTILDSVKTLVSSLAGTSKVTFSSTTGASSTFTLAGLGLDKLLASGATASMSTTMQAVLKSPIVAEFAKDSLTGSSVIDGDTQTVTFPQITLPAGDLGSNADYTKALSAAKVPKDADGIGWVDLNGFVKTLVSPLDPQVGTLVQGQLDHSGGVVLWDANSGSGDDAQLRAESYLPLYQ